MVDWLLLFLTTIRKKESEIESSLFMSRNSLDNLSVFPKLCARQRVSISSATIMSTQKYYKVKAYKIIKILLSSDTSQCLWQNTLSIPHKAGIVFIRWHLIKWY